MRRREFMQAVGTGLATAAIGGSAGAQAPNRSKRPNFVIILADDMGFSDLGCYGSEIATPNLDGLAREGVRFTHFYSAARCCPSRASLLTGLYPHQAGMGGMVTQGEAPAEEGPYQGYLNRSCVTFAEVLKSAGYRTYMSGKWHVGERPEHWPRQRGFDRYYGLISGASSYWGILEQERGQRAFALDDERIVPGGESFYMTDAFTDYAVTWLEEQAGREEPFLLYLAYTAPHWPLHAWPEDIAKYRGTYVRGWDALREERYARLVSQGIIDPKWKLSPRDPDVPPWEEAENQTDWALRMAVYAAMVDRMDQGVGRVLAALHRLGLEKDTLVMFLSDNGGCHESVEGRNLNTPGTEPGEPGSFVAYRRPWANASNTPFRLFKHWVHEGGIATPLIARWPGGISRRGELEHQVGHINDIMATCVDLAGASYPATFNGREITPCEGRSLAPVFRGEQREPHDRLFWEHMGNRAVREGDWKLVAAKSGDWALYNLAEDRTELNDLADAMPERAEAMLQAWDAWAERVGARKPA